MADYNVLGLLRFCPASSSQSYTFLLSVHVPPPSRSLERHGQQQRKVDAKEGQANERKRLLDAMEVSFSLSQAGEGGQVRAGEGGQVRAG